MAELQKNGAVSETDRKSLRLALLASERAISENPFFLEHLLVGLSDESISLAMVCPPGYEDSVSLPGIEIIGHPAINLPLLGRQNRKILIGRLTKFRPTVLHCLGEDGASLARKLARELNLPYVLTVNSLWNRFGRLSLSAKRLAKIVVPTKSIADSVAGSYRRFSNLIEQINMGTFAGRDIRCFSGRARQASIVVAAAMDDAGRFEMLFKAIRHLAIDGHEFMMVLIGAGRGQRAVRELLEGLGLLSVTVFAPKMPDLRPVLSAGDIFIRPRPVSFFDPLLLEAMSAGSTVAACRGGVDDLIIDRQTAVVFDPDDELSIYNSLVGLFNNRQFARKLAAAAQNNLKENHTVSNMVSRLLEIYRNPRSVRDGD